MKYAAILLTAALIELIKRPIFWLIYPIAYSLRKWCRVSKYNSAKLLWYALDDTIYYENLKEYGEDLEYCYYGKRSKFVEKFLPYDFCRSFYWGAWRNNSINLMNETEKWIGPKISIVSHNDLGGKSFYEIRLFASAHSLPYLEYWIGGWRLQIGWISCGRFQQQIRKLLE